MTLGGSDSRNIPPPFSLEAGPPAELPTSRGIVQAVHAGTRGHGISRARQLFGDPSGLFSIGEEIAWRADAGQLARLAGQAIQVALCHLEQDDVRSIGIKSNA